jgi:hypothetical protein
MPWSEEPSVTFVTITGDVTEATTLRVVGSSPAVTILTVTGTVPASGSITEQASTWMTESGYTLPSAVEATAS